MNLLKEHSWPGNIRELKNIIERICLLSSSEEIQTSLIKEVISEDRLFIDENEEDNLEIYFKKYLSKYFKNFDENLNINTQHCMIGNNNQMFNLHRVEDMDDMKKYNLKNKHRGMERPFSIVTSNDGKCLHKENEELSFRNCDNIKNQYWEYSSITGPNN